MKSEHKIFLEKQDSVEAAVDTVISADAPRVILNIPKGSVISASPENFRILSREARSAGKELEIESVDDRVLELATFSGIEASNPIFRSRERAVSDIVAKPRAKKVPMRVVDEEVALPIETKEPEEPAKEPEKKRGKTRAVAETARAKKKPEILPPNEEPEPIHPERNFALPQFKPRSMKRLAKKVGITLVGAGVIAVGWWLAVAVLPHAAISVTLVKNTNPFNVVVETSRSIVAVSTAASGTVALPGELLVNRKNVSMEFQTTGREKVEVKAKGRLTVSNAFSSESQVLVATTRFESPEGKVFRLVERTVVPGAKIESGRIVPSTIDVAVIADAPGDPYNVNASAGWHIPGFKGTPKYEAFTAEAKTPLSGGFIGERPVPSMEEIAAAREKVKQTLQEGLVNQMSALHAEGMKLLESASRFSVVSEDVSSREDTPGVFSMYIEAELREIIFDERMLKDALVTLAKAGSIDPTDVHDFTIEYENVRVDFQNGAMSFPVSGTVVLKRALSADEVRAGILGKDEATLRSFILGLPGVERASVLLTPFWVGRVPTNGEKVTVTID
jgi:hypothetical protein